MAEVPRTFTPHTAPEIRAALVRQLPFDPSPQFPDYAMAQILLETGRGRNMVQHNVGNLAVFEDQILYTPFWRPEWYEPPADDAPERIKRLHRRMNAGQVPSAFAAYPTLDDGMRAYLSLLAKPAYAPLREATTPRQFVEAWKSTGYTPDLDVEATLKSFVQLIPPESRGDGGTSLAWLGLAAVAAGFFLVRRRA